MITEAEIIDRLDRIEAALPIPQYQGIEFVAKKFGVSESWLRNHRDCQPNFGVSDVPGRYLWHLDLITEWVKTTPKEHKRRFANLSQQEKMQIVRNWKAA